MAPQTSQHGPPGDTQAADSAATAAEPLTNGAMSHAAREAHNNVDFERGKKREREKSNANTNAAVAAAESTSTTDATMEAEDTPKKAEHRNQASEDTHSNQEGDAAVEAVDPHHPPQGTKRKASNSEASPQKSARHESHPNGQSAKATPSKLSPADRIKLLNFLLAPSSLALARPKDEIEDLKNRRNGGAMTRTYASSPFTPFEELLNALILSRPIGHMLGVRSIRTLLNPPHNLVSPKLIKETGADGVRQALDEARTQHRQKTAEEIVLLADAVTDTLGEDHYDVSLEKVREECEHDMEKERAMLQKNIKGMGRTGLDIFGRRIQGSWGEWYPFADQKTLDALEKLGLPADTQELKRMLDEHWEELIADDVIGDGEERRRRVFVRVLERAVGAVLEENLDKLTAEALN